MKREFYLFSFATLLLLTLQFQSQAQNKMFQKQIIDGKVEAIEMPKVIYKNTKINNSQKYANMDTLLWMDFESDSVIPDQNNGGDWFNFSFDNFQTNSGDPTDFFIYDSIAIQELATGDTLEFTRLGVSISWMQNLEIGNRNCLVTPALNITQPGAVFRFNSMPQQGPQWSDGFTIKVDFIGDPLSQTADTLVQHKQYRGIGDGPVWHPSFGWDTLRGDTMHTAYNYDNTLSTFTDSGNATVAWMDSEFSLDAYVGQTIYITFFHDSDDDNAIWFDNISVLQPQASGLINESRAYSKLYPNPGNAMITFEFFANKNASNKLDIFNLEGKLISEIEVVNDGFGVQKVRIDASKFEKGIYLIKYFNGLDQISKKLYIE
jgi:hypothetical protein